MRWNSDEYSAIGLRSLVGLRLTYLFSCSASFASA